MRDNKPYNNIENENLHILTMVIFSRVGDITYFDCQVQKITLFPSQFVGYNARTFLTIEGECAMAEKDNKVAKNVPGKFYVDMNCIDCGMCYSNAPENFEEDGDAGVAYVAEQPMTDAAMQLCQEVMNDCPVSAIGDDGE